ncbi:CBO0543 family protein [Virgibacillus sp. JSM 102003]|uniref:CBO0543 family protein n=1 Tax=Virgibacillus sp. JSM 102003 TaxID=1562108 RepID=UPI0035BFCBBB
MSVAVFSLGAIFVPKNISWIEIYGTILTTIVLHLLIDAFLDLKYNLYGYFDKGVEFRTLIFTFGIYPAVNILVVNLFSFIRGLHSKIIYILIITTFALCYEVALIHADIFYHNEWKLWYSAVIYPFLLILLFLNRKFLKSIAN